MLIEGHDDSLLGVGCSIMEDRPTRKVGCREVVSTLKEMEREGDMSFGDCKVEGVSTLIVRKDSIVHRSPL